jgi:hypothetical protein
MKLEGDPDGIAALKAMHEEDKEGVKFLLKDAQTTTDHCAYFRRDGRKWKIRIAADGVIHLEPGRDTHAPPSIKPPSKPPDA